MPSQSARDNKPRSSRGWLRGRGGRFITSGSGFSMPSASAGNISVPRSMARIWRTLKASGINGKFALTMNGINSGMLLEKIYVMNLRMLSYTPRPSSMAAVIAPKSSCVKIISAASFATSVPTMPIEIPTSALRKAGASFTPSPVTATTSPRC